MRFFKIELVHLYKGIKALLAIVATFDQCHVWSAVLTQIKFMTGVEDSDVKEAKIWVGTETAHDNPSHYVGVDVASLGVGCLQT